MKIINRSSKVLTYAAYNAEEFNKGSLITTEWIKPHQEHNKNMKHDAVTFKIVPGRHSILTVFSNTTGGYYDTHKTFKNTVTVLFVNKRNEINVIDWKAILTKKSADLQKHEQGSVAMAEAAAVGQIIINALTVALSAAGPVGGVAGMAVMGLGSILMLAMNSETEEPPPPPNLEQIQDAVRSVVKEELQQSKSEDLAVAFQAPANWLINWARLTNEQLTAKGSEDPLETLSAHDEADFRRELEDFLSPQSPFQHSLNLVHQHPEYALYLLPAYMTGLMADLQIRRIHLMIRHMDGARITVADAEHFHERIIRSKDTFDKSLALFQEKRAQEVTEHQLSGTPEGEQVAEMFNIKYAGIKDVDGTLGKAIFDIKLKSLERDIYDDREALKLGKKAKHLWPEDLDKFPRAKQRSGNEKQLK